MKKLSFFLMAMLMSVMGFAAEAKFDWSGITTTQSPTQANVYTQGDVTLTFEKASGSNIPAENKEGSIRMYKGTTLRIVVAGENNVITNVAFTCTSASYAATNLQYNGEALPSNEWALTTPAADILLNAVANARFKSIVVTYGQVAADYIAAPAISGDVDFIESTEVSIAAGEGLKVYYTLDGTDPTNASPEYTAPFEVKETTTVKAIAYNGENASEVTTQTFTKATQVTCAEAKEIALKVSGNNVPTELTYVVKGYVTNIVADWKSGKQTFWIADTKDGGKVFEAYYCFISKAVTLGDYVQLFGKLTKYNTTPEMADGQATIIPAPVVNHTITVSANPAEGGVVTGGDEYEEGATAILTATANEGYEFVNWTKGEEVVSTENPYSFVVDADVALVANFEEAEPEIEWIEMPLEISNLTTMEMPVGDVTYLQLMGRNDQEDADVMLFLNDYTGEEKAYEVNAESSYMTFGGLELTVMDGSITKSVDPELGDVYAGVVHASVYDDMMGGTMYLALSLTMYGAEPVEVVVENATVVIEERSMGFGDATYSVLILTGEWSDGETTYPVSLVTSEFDPEQESQEVAATLTVGGEGDEDPWLGSGEGNATIAIVDNTVSVSGLFENQYTGFAANATISGTLVITWELNGGELPTATVPTQDSLIAAFKDGYNAYFGVSVATTRAIDNFLYAGAAVNDPTCDVSLFMKDDASPWKWLGDYVLAVTNAQIEAGLLVNLKELATELMWRQSLTGFFLQQAKLDSNYNGNADFTEAGKPEAWGAAYQAAHAVVLPTEPVDAPYTLPTPVKDGFTFVGWYDNAEGTGEAYTVIPAGWAGTLYAIWKQGPTTALENIAVEGKAVKAIINGQLIIIKNGVQYNAQGQVVK